MRFNGKMTFRSSLLEMSVEEARGLSATLSQVAAAFDAAPERAALEFDAGPPAGPDSPPDHFNLRIRVARAP